MVADYNSDAGWGEEKTAFRYSENTLGRRRRGRGKKRSRKRRKRGRRRRMPTYLSSGT